MSVEAFKTNPPKTNQISTKNFIQLRGKKKKQSPQSSSAALRKFNTIHKKVTSSSF